MVHLPDVAARKPGDPAVYGTAVVDVDTFTGNPNDETCERFVAVSLRRDEHGRSLSVRFGTTGAIEDVQEFTTDGSYDLRTLRYALQATHDSATNTPGAPVGVTVGRVSATYAPPFGVVALSFESSFDAGSGRITGMKLADVAALMRAIDMASERLDALGRAVALIQAPLASRPRTLALTA